MNRVHYARNRRQLGSFWLPRWQLWVVLSAIAVVTSSRLHASPVTFRFAATIETVPPTIPFDSGINFAIGDVVSGQFTFDPALGDGSMLFDAHQPHTFALNINGAMFTGPSFEVEAVNNSPVADFPPANLVDTLVLGAGGLQADDIPAFPHLDSHHSNFRMTLYGPDDSVPQAGLPSAVGVWNDFDLWRSIEVSFGDGNGRSVGFQAIVAPFVTVPEPAAGWLGIVTVTPVCVARRFPAPIRRL